MFTSVHIPHFLAKSNIKFSIIFKSSHCNKPNVARVRSWGVDWILEAGNLVT